MRPVFAFLGWFLCWVAATALLYVISIGYNGTDPSAPGPTLVIGSEIAGAVIAFFSAAISFEEHKSLDRLPFKTYVYALFLLLMLGWFSAETKDGSGSDKWMEFKRLVDGDVVSWLGGVAIVDAVVRYLAHRKKVEAADRAAFEKWKETREPE